jgi:hypothetical protein
MASQLLSHSTATALIRNLKSNEVQQLSQFIEIVNSWFDIMNSNNLNESIATKKKHNGLEEQNEILDKMATNLCRSFKRPLLCL